MAVIRQKSLVEQKNAYEDLIKHIQAGGLGQLKSGQVASAKARKILYATLCPDTASQDGMSGNGNYDTKCAAPYLHRIKHYGYSEVLAMIPSDPQDADISAPSIYGRCLGFLASQAPGYST